MKTKFKAVLLSLIFITILALAIFYAVSHEVAVLFPKGMIGIKERDLILTATILMLIVVIPVFVLTLFFAWKYRENNNARHDPDWEHNNIAEMCWWGVPFVIIVILAVLCYQSSHELNPFRPIASEKKALKVQVVALDWKWLFIYPEKGIATVNYLEIPVETPIAFEITSDAPMNSFWIPELGGMIYAMPGMRSKLHLIADVPGVFRGASANISGEGFAGMYFNTVAVSEDEFQNWVGEVSSRTSLTFSEYEKTLVKPSSYDPVKLYSLGDQDLFEQILQKYSAPKK